MYVEVQIVEKYEKVPTGIFLKARTHERKNVIKSGSIWFSYRPYYVSTIDQTT